MTCWEGEKLKKSYFVWLAIYGVVWLLAIVEMSVPLDEIRLMSISLFFILLYLLPLFKEKPVLQVVFLCAQILATTIIFYPRDQLLNPYVVFISTLILAETVFYLKRLKCYIVFCFQLIAVFLILQEAEVSNSALIWYGLFYLLLMIGLLYFQVIHSREKETQRKNEALLNEYRRMKRQLVSEEEQARQDERMLIGHEIHDSVGHKLTALIMQTEAFRLTAPKKDKEKIQALKEMAEISLEETRRAVKSFKQTDVGGLQGVIRLIRKLEMESYMKIGFAVKHGAFAAPLTGEQSFAIYRAVQEALTNMMKHSTSREAQVIFESPGGSIFRFEVINAISSNSNFQEGYGLKAMRQRLEKVGGSLEIEHDKGQFVVRGIIRLTERSGQND